MFEVNCIAAVSGGPDSMALLDMLRSQGMKPAVCHVNYHHRDTADRDEGIVKSYCEYYNIPFHKHDAIEPKDFGGNFQAWAREERYNFFTRTAHRYNVSDLFVAHNMDDVIETYIMQRQRGAIPDYYGIKEAGSWKDLRINRPLLGMEKKALQEYCEKNQIPYGIDESNLTDVFTRNKIRHTIVENLNYEAKLETMNEIKGMNKDLEERRNNLSKYIVSDKVINKALLSDRDAVLLLDTFLHKQTNKHLGKGQLEDTIRKLNDCGYADNLEVIQEEIQYFEEVPGFQTQQVTELPYCGEEVSIDYTFADVPNINKLCVSITELPLTVRQFRVSDKIQMTYGTKRVSQFVRDKKIPKHEQGMVYVVENAQRQIIYVKGLGCDKDHFQPQGLSHLYKIS